MDFILQLFFPSKAVEMPVTGVVEHTHMVASISARFSDQIIQRSAQHKVAEWGGGGDDRARLCAARLLH